MAQSGERPLDYSAGLGFENLKAGTVRAAIKQLGLQWEEFVKISPPVLRTAIELVPDPEQGVSRLAFPTSMPTGRVKLSRKQQAAGWFAFWSGKASRD